MKKLLVSLWVLSLLLCGAAFAGQGEEAGATVKCEIVKGSYVIRIPDANGDLGWLADDMAQDDSVVRLAGAELVDGEFVVQYDPVGDGDMSVCVRHYMGGACDQRYGWDLRVENGAVVECTGGSYTASPDEAEQDPFLSGEWLEAETQFTQMTIARNAARGWDVEIASPMTHGAYIFKATIVYDCDRDGFVYDKGKYWDVPITDSDEDVELGEARVAGATGIFRFTGDGEDLRLIWTDDDHAEQEVVFARADAAGAAADFLGEWNDDRVSATIDARAGGYMVTIAGANGASDSTMWQYTCAYDEETDSLVSDGEIATKVDIHFDEAGNSSEEVVYEDGEASFRIDNEGRLVWDDRKENAGEGRAFERVPEDEQAE